MQVNIDAAPQSASDSQVIDLSIVIVSWNVADLLIECLDSIYDNSVMLMARPEERVHFEVIVVDSASSDDTVERVRRAHPPVKLLAQTENVGFSLGNNIGMEQAQGRYILLLNPDTVVLGDALNTMVRYMDEHPDVGIIGPYTLNTDGTLQPTRRRFPTVAIGFYESTWLQPYAPQELLDYYYVNDQPELATIDVDWVQGSAMMARREVYDAIGGLDTGYVMFSEELDWCKRAKDAGWRVVYLCTAQIIHHGGKSTEQANARKHIHFQESKLRYFRKYHGRLIANLLRVYLLLSYLFQILLEGFKRVLGDQPKMRMERIRTYWQVLRSGLQVT